jgi:hypothetical protein
LINNTRAQIAFGSSSVHKRVCNIDYLPDTGA